ncbi:transcriptional repressor LexA [Bacteriovoracaceae bacterium]|nr:transcriptional repressor LexA [Bacteriovoracaceae bacterium]
MKITKKQKEVYDYIVDYINQNQVSPTQAEIREHFGFKSLGSVQDYIRYLKNAGLLTNDSNSVRGLTPISTANDSTLTTIPMLGRVAAGVPIERHLDNKFLEVPSNITRNFNCFALEVEGMSMIEDGIFEGDHIIVKEQSFANNGETVVATINQEATVKRFYKKQKDYYELHPANATMKPIIVKAQQLNEFEIKGVVVGLIRQY